MCIYVTCMPNAHFDYMIIIIMTFKFHSSGLYSIPYGTKILHGIKFYGFTVVGTTVKLKFVKFFYFNNLERP